MRTYLHIMSLLCVINSNFILSNSRKGVETENNLCYEFDQHFQVRSILPHSTAKNNINSKLISDLFDLILLINKRLERH